MSDERRSPPAANRQEFLRRIPGVPDRHTVYLAGASVDEIRWDPERQTMIYRVDYAEDVTAEEFNGAARLRYAGSSDAGA